MSDKENMTSAYDCSSSSNTRQMTALRAAQAMFANAPPPPPTATGNAWPVCFVNRLGTKYFLGYWVYIRPNSASLWSSSVFMTDSRRPYSYLMFNDA